MAPLQGVDSFIPQRFPDQDRLELDRRALFEEIERLEAVERAQDDELARVQVENSVVTKYRGEILTIITLFVVKSTGSRAEEALGRC